MARTINEITEAMRIHGGESSQWQAYCEDCYRHYGVVPYADTAQDLPVDDDFASYWLAVSERDYNTARDYGDVADEWIEALGAVGF